MKKLKPQKKIYDFKEKEETNGTDKSGARKKEKR